MPEKQQVRFTMRGVVCGPEPNPCFPCTAPEEGHDGTTTSKIDCGDGVVLEAACEAYVPTWVGGDMGLRCGPCVTAGRESDLLVKVRGGTMMGGSRDFYDHKGNFHRHEVNHLAIQYRCTCCGNIFERQGAHIPCVACMMMGQKQGWE